MCKGAMLFCPNAQTSDVQGFAGHFCAFIELPDGFNGQEAPTVKITN
jgi:hypothetical protein